MKRAVHARLAVEIYTDQGLQVTIDARNPESRVCSECGKSCHYASIRIGNTVYCAWHVPVTFSFSVDTSLMHLMYEREQGK